jgi:hypothetical protein
MSDADPGSFLPWTRMNDRERSVWCATYARLANEQAPKLAAQAADAMVRGLRTVELDGPRALDPEYEAARAGAHMEFEEFAPWYIVAYRMLHGNSVAFQPPTKKQIRDAYERFERGRSDFY